MSIETELVTVSELFLTTLIVRAFNKVRVRANPDRIKDSSIKS
jgi:hypothetical protein